jgi:[ribosomal protein S5]-alanine N-acetyltransferase
MDAVGTEAGARGWPVTVAGARVTLRPAVEQDRPALIALYTDPDTRAYLGNSIAFAPVDALRLSPLGLTWGRWVIAHAHDDIAMGVISLSHDRGELEIGYALLPAHQHRGYASEAVQVLLGWAAEALPDDHVIAVVPSSNKRTVRMLKHLGFRFREGLAELEGQQLLLERPLTRG